MGHFASRGYRSRGSDGLAGSSGWRRRPTSTPRPGIPAGDGHRGAGPCCVCRLPHRAAGCLVAATTWWARWRCTGSQAASGVHLGVVVFAAGYRRRMRQCGQLHRRAADQHGHLPAALGFLSGSVWRLGVLRKPDAARRRASSRPPAWRSVVWWRLWRGWSTWKSTTRICPFRSGARMENVCVVWAPRPAGAEIIHSRGECVYVAEAEREVV